MADNNPYSQMLDQDLAGPAPATTLVDQASAPAPLIPGSQPAAQAPVQVGSVDYSSILDADKASQSDALKQSVYAAKDLEPDRHAKVMALASEMKMPVPIVERNYDDLAKKKQLAGTNYDQLIDENPKFSSWLQDPNNAAVAKNDMPALKSLEDQVNDQGFGQTLLNTVGYAMAKFNSGLGSLPALAYDTAALPQNLLKEAMGEEPNIKAPDWLANNDFRTSAKAAAAGFEKNLPQLHYSIVSDLKDMNFKRAAQGMLIQAAAGAPDLTAAIGVGLVNPAMGAAYFGLSSAAQRSGELRDEGVDPVTGTVNALAHGAIATAAGELRVFGPLHEWEHAISNQFGKQVSAEVFKDFFKTLAGTVSVQGGTGAAMSLADDFTDYLTGVNTNALQGSFERAGNAGLVTATAGLTMVAPTGIAAGLARQQQIHQTNSLRDFYLSFGKTAEATKLRANLPEAQRALVETITRDTPVENIYVSPEKIDTYFQSKGMNPVAAMGELGALPEYGAAKETGTDIKIPLATWIDKVVGTEHYTALANDIKFSPDGLSVNDVAQENERIKAEAEKNKSELPAEDTATQVGDTVAKQLSALGVDPKQAEIYESAFRTLGERTGQDPLELFNKFKLNITGEEGQPGQEGQVFNQKTPDEIKADVEKQFTAPDALERYNAIPETKEGMVISQDTARHLYAPYAESREGIILHLDATNEHSEKFAQRAYEERLKRPGNDPVMLLAGGTASGKSTYRIAREHTWEGLTAVVDSTGSNYTVVKSNIEKALAAGKPVLMSFIYRPFDKSLDGNVKRFEETGRLVPPNKMAHSHVAALDTFLRLRNEYKDNPNVEFEAHDNSGINHEEPKPIPVDELEALRYNKAGESVNAAVKSLKKDAHERLKGELEQVRKIREDSARKGEGSTGSTGQDASAGSNPGLVQEGQSNLAATDNEQQTRVLKQAKFDTEGLENVIDSSDRFAQRRENNAEAKESVIQREREAADSIKESAKLLGDRIASNISDMGKRMLNAFSARYNDEKIDKALKAAQKTDKGPYVSDPRITGIGWAPNYAAEPSGTIGPDRISQPNDVSQWGSKDRRFGKNETDPLKWADDKYKAAKELIQKHKDVGIPLTINTSSDLVAKSDYVAAMPDDTTVRMHMLTSDWELNRALFPGNPSVLRQEKAVESLRDQGVKVEVIRPTFAEVVDSAGGEKNVEQLLGDEWQETLKKATSPRLHVIEGDKILFQGGEESARGQIRIGKDGINIQILKDADRSTFLHETGHFYLEVLKSLASDEKVPDQIKDDYSAIQKWLGHEGEAPLSVEQHEQFARGFEAYLMEGKAPSEGLRKAFSAFKVWLTNIYRSLKNLNVELTPEVRGVFDRILATDQEIEAAQTKQNFAPLFKEPAIYGLNPDDFAKYQSAIDSAKLSADDTLRAKVMKDITQEEAALYKEQKNSIQERIEAEANQTRVFKARSLLQLDKLPDGSPRPEGTEKLKIDRKSIVNQFGDEILKRLPRMYAREGGTDVNLVADMLGYESGDQMIQELSSSIPKDEFVRQQTEAQIKDLHPDLLTSPTLPDEAMAAIHNDGQAKVLRMELEFLAKDNMPALKGLIRKVARRVPTDVQIRQQAEFTIGAQNVRELNPGQYKAAEARHAREAGERLSRGDVDGAFESKRLELYNHELFKAVNAAKEDVQTSLKSFKKMAITDEKAAKSRDTDLVATAKAVLSAFGIGKTDESPAIILDKIKRYNPDTYSAAHALVEMASAAGSANYNEISYNRFSDMRDAVKGIWDLARDAKQVEIDGKKLNKDQIIDDLNARINDQNPNTGPRPGYDKSITKWEKTKVALLSAKAMLRRTEHWVTAMDGGDKGTFRTHIWQPVVDGATKFRLAKQEMTAHYLEKVVQLNKSAFDKKAIAAPEIGYQFKNKAELLGALLHTGNESNLSKLLRGRNWGSVDENDNLDRSRWDKFISRMHAEGTLTKTDYDYAQGVWDMYEKMKPDAQRAHKKMYGYYFNEVTANELNTPFGDYRGGYVPAIADPNMSEDAALRVEKQSIEQTNNSYMFPTAGRGFTRSRVEAYAAPLALDLGYVGMQIDKVLRFTHLEPAVRDVGKLVMDRSFRQNLSGLDPTIASEMLVPWLQRSVTQQVSSPSGTGKAWKAADWIFRKIRGNTGLNAMTLNVVNTFHQTTGFSMAAAKVEPHYLRDAMWSYLKDTKGTHADMEEKSEYMKAKGLQISGLQGEINDLILHPTKLEAASDYIKKNGYILQRLTQGAVETVAWQGAYTKGVEEGQSEPEAIRFADSVVRQTQHSSMPEDVSRFGTGSPFARIFTMYFDYYNMKANLLTTEAGNMIRETGIKKSMPSLVGLYTAGLMIPAIMSATFYAAASGDLSQRDDHAYMNEALKIFFGGQFNETMALVPVVGPLINNQVNRFNDNRYDDRLQLSPAIENLQKAWGAPSEIYSALEKNGRKSVAIRDAFSLLGMMTGLPLQPLAKPLGYLADLNDHKIRPPTGPIDFTRGLMTAQGKK